MVNKDFKKIVLGLFIYRDVSPCLGLSP